VSAEIFEFPTPKKITKTDTMQRVRTRLDLIQDQIGELAHPLCRQHGTLYVVMAMLEMSIGGIHALREAGAITKEDMDNLIFKTNRHLCDIAKEFP